MNLFWSLIAGGVLAFAGCRPVPPPPPPTNAPPVVNAPLFLPYAQTNLPVVKVFVGAEELRAECTMSTQQSSTGMMWRTNLAENAAMLFPLGQPGRAAFYMLNTQVPLSAAYMDSNGVILEIHDLKPFDETPVSSDSDQIQYVLEVNQGWFARHGVSTGAVVRTQFGPLSKTFTTQK